MGRRSGALATLALLAGVGLARSYVGSPSPERAHKLSASWVRAKAASMRAAWIAVYGREPTRRELALSLLSPIAETACGDSWPGSNNWGSILYRVASDAEKTTLADNGIRCGNSAAGQTLLQNAGYEVAFRAWLSCDSGEWRWFRVYGSPEEGARAWLVTALGASLDKPAAKVVTDPRGTPAELAHAMKGQGYFETSEASYANSLQGYWPSTMEALA